MRSRHTRSDGLPMSSSWASSSDQNFSSMRALKSSKPKVGDCVNSAGSIVANSSREQIFARMISATATMSPAGSSWSREKTLRNSVSVALKEPLVSARYALLRFAQRRMRARSASETIGKALRITSSKERSCVVLWKCAASLHLLATLWNSTPVPKAFNAQPKSLRLMTPTCWRSIASNVSKSTQKSSFEQQLHRSRSSPGGERRPQTERRPPLDVPLLPSSGEAEGGGVGVFPDDVVDEALVETEAAGEGLPLARPASPNSKDLTHLAESHAWLRGEARAAMAADAKAGDFGNCGICCPDIFFGDVTTSQGVECSR
mmetsp:Transcript_29252/g.62176  ORF Transcript_29252/g.62176 Transcript_29252/m.62176 type:complete len:317 (-) Transcript_29252:91-1041(-)